MGRCNNDVTSLKVTVTSPTERWKLLVSLWHLSAKGDISPVSPVSDEHVIRGLNLVATTKPSIFGALDIDQVMDLIIELLEVSTQEAKNETSQTRGAYVRLAWLRDIYRSKCDAR